MDESKPKKPVWKKWWFWGIVFIVFIVAVSSGGDKTNNQNQTASTQQQKVVADAKQTAAPELQLSGISSNVTIEVLESSSKELLGNNQFSQTKANGIFKVVKVRVTNNQKDAITVSNDSFKLIDDQGREFSYSSDGTVAVASSSSGDKKTFQYEKVNPGITVEGSIPFDVPKDAKGFKMKAKGGLTGQEITLKVD